MMNKLHDHKEINMSNNIATYAKFMLKVVVERIRRFILVYYVLSAL